jgi:hypothetical protein
MIDDGRVGVRAVSVMIAPGVLHRHAAAPDRLFAHLAMSENSDTGAGRRAANMPATRSTTNDSEYTAPFA